MSRRHTCSTGLDAGADLLFENAMLERRFKLALLQRGLRDARRLDRHPEEPSHLRNVHPLFMEPRERETHVRHVRRQCGAVERRLFRGNVLNTVSVLAFCMRT